MTSTPASETGRVDRRVDGGGAEPLQLVLRLGNALDEAGVPYCHWKSTTALERSLSGENDLDLLVARSALRPFTEVLSRLGFVRTYKPGPAIPGIESFYGLDDESERWVHVHAHYHLVLGDDRTKNYRLPIEEQYLGSAVASDGLRVPAPEHEYVVLVIRMVLKYCIWDEIAWCALRGGRAGPTASERRELEQLGRRVDPGSVSAVVEDLLPTVGAALFSDCVAAATRDVPVTDRLRIGRALEVALGSYARRARRSDGAVRVARRVTTTIGRRARGPRKQRLAGGGAMVGIIGGDGAGKSTALVTLEGWLGSEFDVRLVHLGKPRWSATTTAVRGALKVAATGTDVLRRYVRLAPADRVAEAVGDYRPLFWLLCTARDRQHAYRRARRFAGAGGVVLCDRYPHPRLSSMEVPLIESRAGRRAGARLVQAMSELEERYHRSIAAPELLVVLRLDPEVAVARKVDESAESVRRRGAEIWNIDWRAAGAHVVDASRPRDDVARELKRLVWSAIA